MGNCKVSHSKNVHANQNVDAAREDHLRNLGHAEENLVRKSDVYHVSGSGQHSPTDAYVPRAYGGELKVCNYLRRDRAVGCSGVVKSSVFSAFGSRGSRENRGFKYLNLIGKP